MATDDNSLVQSARPSRRREELFCFFASGILCLFFLEYVSFWKDVEEIENAQVTLKELEGLDLAPLNLSEEIGYTEEFEETRGWHPWRKKKLSKFRFYAERNPARLSAWPSVDPVINDPGEEYLPFPSHLVSEKYKGTTRLVHDASLTRLSDDFGMIDDPYTPEDLEDIFQRVVDIYAVGNIYIRINREDLANRFALSRKRSLESLAYSEGPDLAEYTAFKAKNASGMSDFARKYNEWYEREYRKEYPFPVIDAKAAHVGQLRKAFAAVEKYDFNRNLIEWIVGFPHLLTPWDIYHTTPMFPLYVFHGMNGECRGGRITGRTGSCWLPSKKLVDKTTGEFIKNSTCRRFVGSTTVRLKMKQNQRFMRNTEKRTMYGSGAARMWAHEIGHSLGLHHPGSSCNRATHWEDNNLMLQQRHVGLKGEGCPKRPAEDQAKGVAWSDGQIQKIRAFIRIRDIRPSQTLPGGKTIGESTMQMGSQTEPVFKRFSYNRSPMIGSGRKVSRPECTLPQSTIVFTKLNVPFQGEVYRVRWLPSHWRPETFKVVVFVVSPGDQDVSTSSEVKFSIVSRTEPLEVPALRQRMHIELDLHAPLLIQPGQFLAISSVDGSALDIDQQIYASDKVLYGDISGKLPVDGPSIHDSMMKFSEENLAYPTVLVARAEKGSFFFSKKSVGDNDLDLVGRSVSEEKKEKWCSALIFNFDILKAKSTVEDVSKKEDAKVENDNLADPSNEN